MKNLYILINLTLILREGVKNVFLCILALLFVSSALAQQLPTITCNFTANVPLSPCASNITATVTYTNLPVGTSINLVFPNTVAVNPSLTPTLLDNGQFYSVSQQVNNVNGTLSIPMSLSNCNMNGSGASFGGNVLSFDCSANLGNTQIPVGLTGSVGSTFNPDNGGVIQFTVNPNPITLTVSPPSEGFTELYSLGSRNFTITLNSPDVTSFIWNYTTETDISSSGLTIGNGIQQVSNLNFENNQLILPESYMWMECIGNGGQASVTINCPDPCPDIVSPVNVNAFYINTPPSFSISSTNTPNDFTIDGCNHEYVFKYRVNISPAQPITLQSFQIPINEGIYPVESITINGQVPVYPMDINSNGFDVEVTTGFICEYFQGCGQTNNMLYGLGSVQLSYTRPCFPDDIVQVSLPVPNANAGQEFLGTFIGGAQELDYSDAHPTIPVYYEFMTSTGLQFGLGMPNECAMQYQAVITARDINGNLVNISSNLGSTDFTPSITIPIPNVINEVYSNIIFDLTFANCPYPNDPWSGPVTLHAEVQAFCASCSTCYRTLRCIDQTIIAHCNGDCGGAQIGTLDQPGNGMPKPDIKRVTFGWQTDSDYIDGNDPLTGLVGNTPVIKQQLKTFYPYDIFELTAYGHANPGQQVGFEIAYPSISDISFELIEGKFCSPNSDDGSFDAASCFSTPQPTSGIVFGYDAPLVQQRIWFNCQPTTENFKFRGRFRVKNYRPVGFIENELRLQFISVGSPSVNTSCDSYGNRLTFLSPGYDFVKNAIPISTPSMLLSAEGTSSELTVKNNFTIIANESIDNQNIDLCRTSAGLLVSGFGAKGGNNPDFPFEYRPMIDWPSRPEDAVTNTSYTQFNNVVKAIYQRPSGLNSSDYDDNLETSGEFPDIISYLKNPFELPDPILPPIRTSNTLGNVNGVYLELKGECANDNIPVVSEQFRFYHHAYVNHESFKLHPVLDPVNNPPIYPYNDEFHEVPFAADENFTAQLNFNFQDILLTPTYALNGNDYDIPIAILQPNITSYTPPLHPELQNLLIYYNLTYADGSAILSTDASSVGPISSFSSQSITNTLNPTGFSYYFDEPIDFSIIDNLAGLIPVSLACNENIYRLNISMVHFCKESDNLDYVNGITNSACDVYERTLILNPTEPSTVNHISNLQLINTINPEDCYLQWTVTIDNPAGSPEIVNPNFVFNTPNGLILESQSVQAQHFFPSNSTTSVLLPLTNPTFSLSAMAPPFSQNSLPTYSLSPVNPIFTLQGNARIVYIIRFKFSSTLCQANLNTFNLLGRFSGKGFCAEESAPATILEAFIQPFGTTSPSGNCCVDPPINVNVINACPGQNGTIIITPTDGADLDGVYYQVINSTGIYFQSLNLAGTTSIAPISLPIGFYAVLVTLANGNQMSFNANIQNGELSLQLTIPTSTVCQNSTFTASVLDINPNNTPTYTYDWANANGLSVGTTNPYTTQNPIAGNYNVNVIHTITGCRASLPFTINVDQPPTPANAGIPQTICTSTVTLAALQPIIGNGVWSATNATIIFDNPNSENSTVTGLSAGPNTLTWTVSNGVCAASVSTVNITVQLPPIVDAGIDQTVCGANATLGATPNPDGSWSLVSGTGNFANSTLANSAITGLSVGANVFRWTVNNGVCPEVFNEVTITSNVPPSAANAGTYQPICDNSITLAATSITIGSGVWSSPNTAIAFQNANSPNAIASNLAVGTNTLTWTVTSGVCSPSVSTVIISRQLPPPVNAGLNQTVCGSTATLGATATPGGIWSVIEGTGTFATATLANTGVTGLTAGINTFRWTVNNGVCPVSFQEVTINSNALPSAANAGTYQPICDNSITLAATPVTIGSGVWSSPNSAIAFQNANSLNAIANNLAFGNNTLTWTVTNGVCPPVSSTVVINVQQQPISNAGIDQTVCGASAILAATNVPNGTWTVVSGTGIFESANTFNSIVNGLSVGANVFKWTVNNSVCPEALDEVIINSNPIPVLSLQSPQNVCNDQLVNINLTPAGGQLFINNQLALDNALNTNSIQSNILQIGANSLSYSLINNFGCSSSASANINVEQVCPCNACTDPDIGIVYPEEVNSYQDIINSMGASVGNRCLFITDDIVVTDFLYFENCSLIVAAGKKIEIAQSGMMHINGSLFKGCDRMWVGIKNYGKVRMTNSTIKDAHIGFEMMRVVNSGPFSTVYGNTFSNNFIGLSNSLATGNHKLDGPKGCRFLGGELLPGYQNQIPAPNPLGGHAGIVVLNGFPMNINKTNSFDGLYNGVVVFRAPVKVNKAIFKNIQYDPSNLLYPNNTNTIFPYFNHPSFPSAAINASFNSLISVEGYGTELEDETMFYGCRNSVASAFGNITVNNVKIDSDTELPSDVGISILSTTNAQQFMLTNNRIRSQMAGISLIECGNFTTTQSNVSNNNITILDNFDLSPSITIDPSIQKYGIQANSALLSKSIQIFDNTINIRSYHASHGISINQSPFININENLIRRFTSSFGGGIVAELNSGAQITCNSSVGMEEEVLTVQNDAYTIHNSSLYLRDNYSSNTQTGISINETCTGIDLANNEMGDHTYDPNPNLPSGALYLGYNANIDL